MIMHQARILYVLVFVCVNVITYCLVSIPLFKLICTSYAGVVYSEVPIYLSRITTEFFLSIYALPEVIDFVLFQGSVNFCSPTVAVMHAMPWTSHTTGVVNTCYIFSSACDIQYMSTVCTSKCEPFADESIYIPEITLKDHSLSLHNVSDLLEVLVLSKNSNTSIVEFYTLQNRIFILAGETSLVFFRIYNPTTYIVSCITVYVLYPEVLTLYLNKAQCFCFEPLTLRPYEILDLPVLFFITPSVQGDVMGGGKIVLMYILFS